MTLQAQFLEMDTTEATLYVTVVSKRGAVLSAAEVAEIASGPIALGHNFEETLGIAVEDAANGMPVLKSAG